MNKCPRCQETSSNNKKLEHWIGFKPKTSIEEGITRFIKWYKDFYNC